MRRVVALMIVAADGGGGGQEARLRMNQEACDYDSTSLAPTFLAGLYNQLGIVANAKQEHAARFADAVREFGPLQVDDFMGGRCFPDVMDVLRYGQERALLKSEMRHFHAANWFHARVGEVFFVHENDEAGNFKYAHGLMNALLKLRIADIQLLMEDFVTEQTLQAACLGHAAAKATGDGATECGALVPLDFTLVRMHSVLLVVARLQRVRIDPQIACAKKISQNCALTQCLAQWAPCATHSFSVLRSTPCLDSHHGFFSDQQTSIYAFGYRATTSIHMRSAPIVATRVGGHSRLTITSTRLSVVPRCPHGQSIARDVLYTMFIVLWLVAVGTLVETRA